MSQAIAQDLLLQIAQTADKINPVSCTGSDVQVGGDFVERKVHRYALVHYSPSQISRIRLLST